MRSIAPWRFSLSPTGYEPKLLDNFHYSETYTAIFQNESVDVDTEPSYSFDAELDDETIVEALSSPLFIQERQEPADRRQAYHSDEQSLLPAQSFSTHTQERGDPRRNLSCSSRRRTTYHSDEQSLLPAQSFSTHTQERGDPWTNLVRSVRAAEKNQVAKWKTKQSGLSFKDQKSKFSLILEPIFRNMNFKPILSGGSFRTVPFPHGNNLGDDH